jgi:hypothetical protein
MLKADNNIAIFPCRSWRCLRLSCCVSCGRCRPTGGFHDLDGSCSPARQTLRAFCKIRCSNPGGRFANTAARPRAPTSELVGRRLPQLPAPFADGFVGYQHTTDQEELFAVPMAEAEAVIEPDPMAHDLGWKPRVLVALRDSSRRPAVSPSLSAYTMHHLAYSTGAYAIVVEDGIAGQTS